MRKYLALTAVLFLPLSVLAQTTWKSDPQHSRLGFAVTHLGISDISGAFRQFDARIQAAKADFSDAQFELTVDTSSIDTAVQKRDDHLRSADFFAVNEHPKMTFRSSGIEPAGRDRYTLKGELTIRGQTRPVTAELWYRGTTKNQENTTAGFQLITTLKRSDFGVGDKFKPPMISDEVRIQADGEFIQQSSAGKK